MAAKTLDEGLLGRVARLHHIDSYHVDAEATVWRYLDRDKFDLFLQQEGALWFSRPDCFDDIFEGSISEINDRFMSYGPDITPERLEEMKRVAEWYQQWTFINCWVCAEEENALMWAAYAKDGVVLKSTFGRLVGALPSNCRVGPVQYVDFSKQLVTEGLQDWHKRHYFRNEREVRARFQDVPAGANSLPDLTKSHPEKGRLVKVDPNVFLTAIVCRPYALLEELERVRRDCVQVGIAVPVQPSTMSGVPKLV